MADKYEVPIIFSAPSKLSRLCASIGRAGLQPVGCEIKHSFKYVASAVKVVHKICLSCVKVYIGQTGRWINVRAREHSLSLRSSPSGHLAVHCNKCGCSPRLGDIEILARQTQKLAREIDEPYYIRLHGPDLCVSSGSITLFSEEFEFVRSLGPFVWYFVSAFVGAIPWVQVRTCSLKRCPYSTKPSTMQGRTKQWGSHCSLGFARTWGGNMYSIHYL